LQWNEIGRKLALYLSFCSSWTLIVLITIHISIPILPKKLTPSQNIKDTKDFLVFYTPVLVPAVVGTRTGTTRTTTTPKKSVTSVYNFFDTTAIRGESRHVSYD
jgi:hypothetical protein